MGVLKGVRVIEMAGLGPGPFAGMLLADMGASIIRIDRPGGSPFRDPLSTFKGRGRRSIALNLKDHRAIKLAVSLIAGADVLIEGYRPGVMERLGLGPQPCLARNPKLVYGRMTGYGQHGPLAQAAGHDLNYLAIAGALHGIGPADRPPPPPLNLIGDYGGGGMALVVGILGALIEAGRSGQGQVVDAAMVDGAAQLMTPFIGMIQTGHWSEQRHNNLLDGAAYFYRCYRCADGKDIAVGSIEPQFHAALIATLGLDPADWDRQNDQSLWAERSARLEALFATRARDEWARLFEGVDACVTPVLSPGEAVNHPHARARNSFVAFEGAEIPAPAPRLSATPASIAAPAPLPGADSRAILAEAGHDDETISALIEAGAVGAA